MYKQMNAIYKPKSIWLFALIINCALMMKTKLGFPGMYIAGIYQTL